MPATVHDLPPALREALTSTPLERRSWRRGIAPAYLGLFSLIVYYDQLALATLPMAGVVPALLGSQLVRRRTRHGGDWRRIPIGRTAG